ncbi:MAG: sulfite exporter TauE/SafE family protein [Mailhella sp.]|nr:sulfite exporter TauE/SafE family protein [Mailhella sp.]
MMLLEMLVVFIGLLLGGFASGAAAFGTMMIALPILILVLNATDAVLVCCLVSVPAAFQLAWLYHHFVRWSDMKMLWLGCIPGSMAGAYALKVVSMDILQLAISISIAFFLLLQIFLKKISWRLPDSRSSLLVAGTATGFCTAAFSLGGVPIGIFILLKGWGKDRARATMSMLFVLSCFATMSSQWFAGLYTGDFAMLALCGCVASFIGQEIGFRAGRHLNQKMFTLCIFFFLSVAAVTLFYKAIW